MTRPFPGWKVVAGSAIGIPFGSQTVFAAGFALLASAIAHEFGWSQAEVARAATIFLLCQMVAQPVAGWCLDRWGSRTFACASIAAFAASLVVLSQVNGSVIQFYLAFALLSIVSVGTNPVAYARAIALWFNRRRGIALGIAGSSQALGFFLIPILAQKGIALYGWPVALWVLAGFEIVICLPLVALLVKDDPAPYGLHADGMEPAGQPVNDLPTASKIDFGKILRTATFWKLAVCFALMGMSYYAIASNIVFILNKTAGLSMAQIAGVQSVGGLSVLFGRVGVGHLLDKIQAPAVCLLALVSAAITAVIYALTADPMLIVVAAVLSGFAIGGDADLMPYLAGRYFGTQSISRVFSCFLFAWFFGASTGPVIFAQLTVTFGGASIPLLLVAVVQLVPAVLFLSLGRYRNPELSLLEPPREMPVLAAR